MPIDEKVQHTGSTRLRSGIGDTLKKWIAIIIGLGVICSSVAGTLYAVDKKMDAIDEKNVDVVEYQEFVVFTKMEFIDQDRRRTQQKIWDIEREFGYDCSKMPRHIAQEYNRLKEELRRVDSKIMMLQKKRGVGIGGGG
jgi:hypothetical protein